MKIVNIHNQKINGAFQFNVGNCTISVSTMFNKERAEIAIFDSGNNLLNDKLSNIQQAIHWVNGFGPRD